MRYTISTAITILGMATGMARAEVPTVVADIPPVGALVAQVMGDLGTPQVLLTGGADPHDFQLRPSQARALSQAGLVVWIGPELTPWLDRALEGSGEGARLTLLQVKGTHLRQFADSDEDHDHDHEAAGADHHDAEDEGEAGHDDHDGHDHDDAHHDEAGHHHTGTDPHAWLEPANAAVWLEAIAAELTRLDPPNAATYRTNAATALAALATLDADIRARITPVKDRPFVTFHDAYGYLVAHYGLTQLGAVAEGDAASPGAARLRTLQAGVEGHDVCLFPEVQHDPALVTQMAEATGARLGQPLDPEGSSLAAGPEAYAEVMNRLADTLVACLAK